MNVLETYQVKFFTKTLFAKPYPLVYTKNEALSSYISEYDNLSVAIALLNETNSILQSDKLFGKWDTLGLMVAKITALETKIYNDVEAWANNEDITPDCILSTIDFKIIVEAWIAFLQQQLK